MVLFLMIFGRIELILSVSKAKFDEEVDFEVRLGVALQKTRQIGKKQNLEMIAHVSAINSVQKSSKSELSS